MPGGDEPAEALRPLPVDAQQPVAVGAGAGAAGPVLDAEEVVEQRRDEVVVQPLDVEGEDGQARGVERAVDPDARVAGQPLHRRRGPAPGRGRGCAAAPAWSLSAKASPARRSPRMSGVPPSSRSARRVHVVHRSLPAGRRRSRPCRRPAAPGCGCGRGRGGPPARPSPRGPPRNLWVETKMASSRSAGSAGCMSMGT